MSSLLITTDPYDSSSSLISIIASLLLSAREICDIGRACFAKDEHCKICRSK